MVLSICICVCVWCVWLDVDVCLEEERYAWDVSSRYPFSLSLFNIISIAYSEVWNSLLVGCDDDNMMMLCHDNDTQDNGDVHDDWWWWNTLIYTVDSLLLLMMMLPLIVTCTDRAINYPLHPPILLIDYRLTGVVIEPQHFGVRPYAVLSDRLGEP